MPERRLAEVTKQILIELQPRSIHEGRWAAIIAFVTVAMSCFLMSMVDVAFGGEWRMTSAFYDPDPSILNAVILPLGTLATAATIWSLPTAVMRYAPLPLVMLGASLTTIVNFLSGSADLTSQAFFMLSVLYGTYTLRFRAAGFAVVFICLNEAITGYSLNLDGDWLAGSMTFAILNVGIWLGFGRAQASRHERESALKKLATQDPLTGLANRTKLERCLQRLSEPEKSPDNDETAALLLVDLDLFKSLNDNFGHPFGDEVLKNVATHLEAHDHAGSVAARIGGDELAMFLPDCSIDEANEVAKNVLSDVRKTRLNVAGQSVTYSVSIGVAHWPTSHPKQASLYSAADIALYDAKRRGRDQFRTYDPTADYEGALPSDTLVDRTDSPLPRQAPPAAEATGPIQ